MNDTKQSVEKMGVLLERMNHKSPLECRVFAFLLISEPPYKSFDEIREFLGASKSAVSNAINYYLRDGSIIYKTFNGDRKRYFMVNTEEWENKIIEKAQSLTEMNQLLNEVLKNRENSEHVEFYEKIKKLNDFQTFLSQKMNQAIEEWVNK
ncbi:GbsR/MarR family transcriptional regulator [Membranihabitans marinus]|uniref:GbsR/MarR family transcriptional regulator n=1 Tax=Membranihabitans marinus TaxID=1227546 RepID=UPI001F36DF7C|nr:hypothetical protein [Membranihabitans marinus]